MDDAALSTPEIVTFVIVAVLIAGLVFWAARSTRDIAIRKALGLGQGLVGRAGAAAGEALRASADPLAVTGAVALEVMAYRVLVEDGVAEQIAAHPLTSSASELAGQLADLGAASAEALVENGSLLAASAVTELATQLQAVGAEQVADFVVGTAELASEGAAAAAELGGQVAEVASDASDAALEIGAEAFGTGATGGLVSLFFAGRRTQQRVKRGDPVLRNALDTTLDVGQRAAGIAAVGAVTAASGGAAIALAIPVTAMSQWISKRLHGRHLERAQQELQTALEDLGKTYATHDDRFRRLVEPFQERERDVLRRLAEAQATRDAYMTWTRRMWPTSRGVVLTEIVRRAEAAREDVQGEQRDAVLQLTELKEAGAHHALGGVIFANRPTEGFTELPASDFEPVERARAAVLREGHAA